MSECRLMHDFTVYPNAGPSSSGLTPCLFVYNPGLERGKRVRWEEWIATNLTRTPVY
ncbi:hypothetical protein CC79DRAFT_1338269 [Sarocladium strictum]